MAACEMCGAKDGALGYHDDQHKFHELSPMEAEQTMLEGGEALKIELRTVRGLRWLLLLCQHCEAYYQAHIAQNTVNAERQQNDAGDQLSLF